MGRTSRAFLSTVFALVLAIGLVPVAQAEPSSTTSTASDTQQATESAASQQSDSLTVQSTKDINDPSIQVMGLGDKLWTGSAITPYITVLDTHPLTQGTDYTVSYSNNINVGQARVTITGMGNYTGTRTELFNIVNQQPISNCTITVGAAVYYGDPVMPQVTVTTPSGKTLTENYEYTVAYSDNTGVGTGTVTVTATASTSGSTNLYTGSATKQFTITQGQTSIKGSGTESDPYQISTIDDLKFVSHVVNTGKDNCSYASAHYKLMNNIDASAAQIDPIGTSSHTSQTSYGFAGTFDGSGHTITMGTASAPSTHALFGYIARNSTSDTLATIKNLTVAGNFAASHTYMTSAAFADAIGTMPVTFTGCTNKASVSAFLAAGFVSSSTSTQLTFNNCTNEGAVNATENSDSQADGFVSGSNGTSSSPNNVATFTGCRNAGAITGAHSAAGFAGRVADKQGLISDFVFTNCSNEGTITSSAGNAGGLLGALSGVNYASYTASVKITTSTNSGTISGALNSGGLVGQGTSKLSIDIKDSYNKGAVSASGSSSYAAGLVGGVTDASCALTVTNAYNAGTVSGTNGAGVLGEAGASASAAFTNAYFLNSATKAVASTNSTATVTGSPTSKSLDQMKATGTQGMAAALGSAFKDADNDTPLLGWQQGGLVPKTDLSTATLSAISNVTYNGTEQKPEPTVTLAGKQLTANTDFTYSYTSNKDAGTATVTVSGIGSYEGSVNATFTIDPATVTSIDSVDDQTYTGSAITPKPGVHAGSMVLTEGTDFTYSYTSNTQLNSQASVAATAKGNFTGNVSTQFKIVAASITDATVDAIAAQTYTGTDIKPAISVTLKGKQLSNPTDYTVAYSSNVHAGEASITLTGAGNYQGSKTVKFTISPLQAQLAWTGDSSLVYDGAAKNVTASVSNLASSDVCAVTVAGGTESAAGTHMATATALTGTSASDYVLPADATHTYNIAAASLASASIADIADSAYTGSAITPEPEVTFGGKKLVPGTDFDYSYKGNTAAGKATVTITGKGNYQGTASKTFAITTVSVDKLTIQDIADQEYTGSALTPKPVVKLGSYTLQVGTDYTLSYSNNTDMGTAAKVTVMGTGSITGSRDLTFSIVRPKHYAVTLPVNVVSGKAALDSDVTADTLLGTVDSTVNLSGAQDATSLTLASDKGIAALRASVKAGSTPTINVLDGNGKLAYGWTFTGAATTQQLDSFDLALSVSLGDSTVKAEVPLENASDTLDEVIVIDFSHAGILPTETANVRVYLGGVDPNLAGKTNIALFHRDDKGNVTDTGQRISVDADCYTDFSISGCSDYLLRIESSPEETTSATTTTTAASTAHTADRFGVDAASGLALVIIASLMIAVYVRRIDKA